VRAKYGEGELIYIPTLFWFGSSCQESSGAGEFVSLLERTYALRTFEISGDVIKACLLRGEDGILLFAFNYTGEDATASVRLPVVRDGSYTVTDLYTGESAGTAAADGCVTVDIAVRAGDVSIRKILAL